MLTIDDRIQRDRFTSGRHLGDYVLAMNTRQGALHRLGGVGGRIWQLVEGPVRVGAVLDRLCEEYTVTPVELAADVVPYLQGLVEKGIFRRSDGKREVPADPSPLEAPVEGEPPVSTLDDSAMFSQASQEQAKRGRPLMTIIEIITACNLNCEHCYLVEGRTEKSRQKMLTREEMHQTLAQLADLGVFVLTITGGEPFLHPDIFDYLDEASRLGFAISIFSALALPDPTILDRLLDYNIYEIETSFHGADARTHDRFTARPGSFDRLVASLTRLRRLGLRVNMKTNWTRYNYKQYEQMMAFPGRYGAGFRATVQIDPRHDGTTDNMSMALDDEELLEFFLHTFDVLGGIGPNGATEESLMGEPNPDDPVCGGGRTGMRIDPWGNVFPCIEVVVPAGNVRKRPLEDIWRTGEILEQMRSLRVRDMDFQDTSSFKTHECGSCNMCPGINMNEKGALTSVAESSKRISRIHRKAVEVYLGKLAAAQ